jgi:hypothetical protein
MMRLKKALVVLLLLFAGTVQTFAQPGNPDDDPDDAVPITGIEWLIAGGCALGLRKLLSGKKSTVEE